MRSLQVGQVRRPVRDLLEIINGELDVGRTGHSEQVEYLTKYECKRGIYIKK